MQSNSEQIRVICSSLGFVADTFELNSASTYHHLSLKAKQIGFKYGWYYDRNLSEKLDFEGDRKDSTFGLNRGVLQCLLSTNFKNDTIPTEFREIVFHTVSKRAFVQKVGWKTDGMPQL